MTMMAAKTILDKIVRWKVDEVARHKRERPIETLRAQVALDSGAVRDFGAALAAPGVSLIAEVKRASPSAGLLRHTFDAEELAHAYAGNGARAISVLTDQHFFQGNLGHLGAVRQAVDVPVLRKDFIIDQYQVYEARAAGADAILLIVAALGDGDLRALYERTYELGMHALVEVHNADELERALAIAPRIIGINNRDLRTFNVTLDTTEELASGVPEGTLLVAESGIYTAADVRRLRDIGVDAMLVGTSLVKSKHVGAKVRELVDATR